METLLVFSIAAMRRWGHADAAREVALREAGLLAKSGESSYEAELAALRRELGRVLALGCLLGDPQHRTDLRP